MRRRIRRGAKQVGLAPGSLVHLGDRKADQVSYSVIEYNQEDYEEKSLNSVAECLPFKESKKLAWINICGLHDVNIIQQLGENFGLHPLVLEDIVNTTQRPKIEDLGEYLFVVVKMVSYKQESGEIDTEQVSFILAKNYVISFQEKAGDVFDPVRARIKSGKGRIRKTGTDYLLYALVDAVVDHYFVVLEKISEKVEYLDEILMSEPTEKTLRSIYHLKREMLFLRKSVWPLREVIGNMEKGDMALIKKQTTVFLRDVYDHTIQVIDTVETYRDMLSSMLDLYLSSAGHKMNEVMKVLTLVATIFIPLTFIAGIYGMNFKYMPELEWDLGYPMVWAVMIIGAAVMIYYFKRKRWL